MSAWTKRTAERAYTDGAKQFDAWFYSHPKAQQELMREKGILPYREMPQPRHAFPIVKEHKAFPGKLERKELKEHKVVKVSKVFKVHKELLGFKALREVRDFKVLKVLKVE